MIAERLRDSPLARRAAALLILALLLWMLAPLVTGPFQSWQEGRETVEAKAEILQRLERLDARRATVGALAGQPEPPFLIATDASVAADAMIARLRAAADPGAMRLDGIQPMAGDARPGSPVRLSFGFTATQGGLQAFLAAVETRPPFMRVERLVASPIIETGGSVTLAGTGSVAAVPLLKAAP